VERWCPLLGTVIAAHEPGSEPGKGQSLLKKLVGIRGESLGESRLVRKRSALAAGVALIGVARKPFTSPLLVTPIPAISPRTSMGNANNK